MSRSHCAKPRKPAPTGDAGGRPAVRISVIHKWMLCSVLLVVTAAGLSTYFGVRVQSKALTAELIRTGVYQAEHLAAEAENAFSSLNWIYVERSLHELPARSAHDVIFAKLVKPDGEVYLANDRAYYGEKVPSNLIPGRQAGLNHYFTETDEQGWLLVHPFTVGSETWHVVLGLSLAPVRAATHGLILRNLAWGGLIVLLGVVSSFFLARSVSRPVTRLAEAAKRMAAGDWDCSIPVGSRDEIGLLTRSFNRMTGQLRHQREQIVAYSHDLEQKVAERTADLSEANDELKREVTVRKRGEEALARSNAELEQFAYVASHDLQEPLRMVTGYVQMLARRYKGQLDADADDFIGFAVDGAERMATLINDLLAYSRVTRRGKAFEPTDCQAVMQEVLANLEVAVTETGAEVTHDPLPTVVADRTQLGRLLQNLIGNAITYHGEAPPKVHVSAEQAGGGWQFAIRDNGIGIEPQYHERIFAIFQRLHGRDEYEGTGIGLAIAKKIVERHNGRIWIESEPGTGSTFYFTVPQREAETDDESSNHAPAEVYANAGQTGRGPPG